MERNSNHLNSKLKTDFVYPRNTTKTLKKKKENYSNVSWQALYISQFCCQSSRVVNIHKRLTKRHNTCLKFKILAE